MRYKKNLKFKDFLLGVLVVLLLFGLGFFAVKSCSNDDETMKEVNLSWSVGSLNQTGKYLNSDKSIYTDKMFDCVGLEIELDFESSIQYQVFYYDDLGNFISSSAISNESQDMEVADGGVQARIVVTPIYQEDLEEEDKVIKWYQVNKYAKQLKAYVYKNQLVDTATVLTFDINDNDEVVITGTMDTTIDELVIPNTIIKNGIERKVVEIDEQAFLGLENLKSVTIPSNVKIIDSKAFKQCKQLTNVNLSAGLVTIGGSAFTECDSLKSVVLPSTVKTIHMYAFADNINMTTIILNEGLESINKFAFDGCTKLTNIVIPSTVLIIGENA